jgi:hypothetical protein
MKNASLLDVVFSELFFFLPSQINLQRLLELLL